MNRFSFGVLASIPVLALLGGRTTLAQDETATEDPFRGADRLTRVALVDAVLARNPSIEAARQGWQAALEREPQAASLDDPTASYALSPLSVGSSAVRYGQRFEIAQRLPYPGKLRLRGEIERARAEAARHDYESVRLELATIASLLFDEYYFVHRALEINDEHRRLLEDFQRVATARYTSGLAAQQDPIQAEVELAHLHHRDVVLRTGRATLAAELNALLHRLPEAVLPPPPLTLAPPDANVLVSEPDEDDVLEQRPELGARIAEVEARQTEVRLREKDFRPDFTAMSSYNSMWGEFEHRWMLGVGVSLPLRRDRLRAGVAEAKAELRRAESERESVVDVIRTEIHTARLRLEEAAHVLELFRSRLLPASADQIGAARAGFETGQNSFLALLEAERNQRDVELGYEEALTNVFRRRAELDRALGRMPLSEASSEGDIR